MKSNIFLGLVTIGIIITSFQTFGIEKIEAKQFTFSWQFTEKDKMKPRGGTTRGKAIELDPRNYVDWRKERDSKSDKFDMDLVAIMSLTGMYRVSFDFLETIVFENDVEPDVPYQSWGTEYVFPVEIKNGFVSLQHILIMEFKSDEVEPYVMKHWREDWTYEDRSMLVYTDLKNWQIILSAAIFGGIYDFIARKIFSTSKKKK